MLLSGSANGKTPDSTSDEQGPVAILMMLIISTG